MRNMPSAGPTLVRRQAASHGHGVFTTRFIPAGARVLAMTGRELPTPQVTHQMRAMQIAPDRYLVEHIEPGDDGSEPQYLDNYLNHSCQPNVGFIDGSLSLHALRDIHADEELLWDYSTSMNEPGWELPCFCGSQACRGRIQSYCDLPADVQAKLRPIVLAYLRS